MHTLRQGLILAAAESISEGVFAGARVLVVKYSPTEGTIGVILNRTFTDPSSNQLLRCGGPLSQDSPRVLHNNPHITGCYQVIEGVYVGGEVQEILAAQPTCMFVFYGYCLWRPKQLDGEVRSGLWRVEGLAQTSHIFGSSSLH